MQRRQPLPLNLKGGRRGAGAAAPALKLVAVVSGGAWAATHPCNLHCRDARMGASAFMLCSGASERSVGVK